MTTHYYSNWRTRFFTCEGCGWTGCGRDLAQGEVSTDGHLRMCPRCGKLVVGIVHPTLAEARLNWANLPEEERQLVERLEREQAEERKRAT